MQGRHSSNVGPRGLQPASNTVPPSLFLASHESDISIPPSRSKNTQNANSFSLHQEPAGIDGDIWWGSWPTYLVYSPKILVRWLASLLSSS